jgi:hypothetical protein
VTQPSPTMEKSPGTVKKGTNLTAGDSRHMSKPRKTTREPPNWAWCHLPRHKLSATILKLCLGCLLHSHHGVRQQSVGFTVVIFPLLQGGSLCSPKLRTGAESPYPQPDLITPACREARGKSGSPAPQVRETDPYLTPCQLLIPHDVSRGTHTASGALPSSSVQRQHELNKGCVARWAHRDAKAAWGEPCRT